jgi:hypothetical protein
MWALSSRSPPASVSNVTRVRAETVAVHCPLCDSFFWYCPNKVKDRLTQLLIDSIYGMVEKKLCSQNTPAHILPARWYQFFHEMSSLHKHYYFLCTIIGLEKRVHLRRCLFMRNLPNFQERCIPWSIWASGNCTCSQLCSHINDLTLNHC